MEGSGLEVDLVKLTLEEELTAEMKQALLNLKQEDPTRTAQVAQPPGTEQLPSLWTNQELHRLSQLSGYSVEELLILFPAGDEMLRKRYAMLQRADPVLLDQLSLLHEERARVDGSEWQVPLPWTRTMLLALTEPEPIEEYWRLAPEEAAPILGMVLPPGAGREWYQKHLFEYAESARILIEEVDAGLYLARGYGLRNIPDGCLRLAVGPSAAYGKNALLAQLRNVAEGEPLWLATKGGVGLGRGSARTWFDKTRLAATVIQDGALPGYPSALIRLTNQELAALAQVPGLGPACRRAQEQRSRQVARVATLRLSTPPGLLGRLRALLEGHPLAEKESKLDRWIADLPALIIENQTGEIHQRWPDRTDTIRQQLRQEAATESYQAWVQLFTI